jgi:hypothetical protein
MILQGLASAGQHTVARALNCDEATISRLKSHEQKINLQSIARMLAVMGLKVVPAGHHCYPADYIDSLKLLARRALDASPSLDWSDADE